MKADARELLDKAGNLNVGKSVDRRAPHKPLLLLLAVAGIQKQLPRLREYSEIEEQLTRALAVFGRPAKSQNPQYPFWRLQNDKIWEVESEGPMTLRRSSNDPPRSQLLKSRARGGFFTKFYDVLFGDEELQSSLIHQLLDSHFPPSMHEDIIGFFDLEVGARVDRGEVSEPAFRRAVLQAYDLQCAVSGYSTIREGFPLGVEAAYIRWPQSGGRGEVSNGIALNTLYRKLFDLGLFTVTLQFRVQVSSEARNSSSFEELLGKFNGRRIKVPASTELQPSAHALRWHASEVFRS